MTTESTSWSDSKSTIHQLAPAFWECVHVPLLQVPLILPSIPLAGRPPQPTLLCVAVFPEQESQYLKRKSGNSTTSWSLKLSYSNYGVIGSTRWVTEIYPDIFVSAFKFWKSDKSKGPFPGIAKCHLAKMISKRREQAFGDIYQRYFFRGFTKCLNFTQS